MSDKKTLEQHKRNIASLRPDGVSSGIQQTFDKAAVGQKLKKFTGVCSVCGQPFYPGFAVRCSVCTNSLFHASCFGTHVMKFHSPSSVTVVLSAGEKPDQWIFVDADPPLPNEPVEEEKIEEEVEEEKVEEPEPEPHIAAVEEENTREVRATRTKKRQHISE